MPAHVTDLARAVVADDHPLYRATMVRALRDTGRFAVVGEAADGERAHALILEHRPDLAVVDVRIPRLDGLALLARLRLERVPVPVVIVSACIDGALVEAALARGAVACVAKLAGSDDLQAVALTLVGGRAVHPARIR